MRCGQYKSRENWNDDTLFFCTAKKIESSAGDAASFCILGDVIFSCKDFLVGLRNIVIRSCCHCFMKLLYGGEESFICLHDRIDGIFKLERPNYIGIPFFLHPLLSSKGQTGVSCQAFFILLFLWVWCFLLHFINKLH